MAITQFFFVYGTLMQGFHSFSGWQKKVKASLVGSGTIRAKLYDLGDYPGAVPAHGDNYLVKGELYEISYPEKAVALLDEYEGFVPLQPDRSLFARMLIPVTTEDGSICEAWTYLYNHPVNEKDLIPSGDYRKR